MWIANRKQQEHPREGAAELGTVTLAGEAAGVYLEAERRNAAVYAPRGYHWTPKREEESLVIGCGDERRPCIIGMQNTGERPLGPGEVWISAFPGSGIHLKQDGSIALIGPVYVNGTLLTAPAGTGG